MEFEGVVYRILPPTSGTSARGEWKRQEVVFELPQEFSRKICVTFFNKESDVAQLREGMTCTVSVNVESREFNGRWYTDVKAWRVQPKVAEAPAAAETSMPEMPSMPPFSEEPSYAATPAAEVDDLPF
ncbi:MAG: DUF3127 domain-containing protein [Alistipes sp.]|nr:DUF3127 domain-containing protein [Alistipes sp.]